MSTNYDRLSPWYDLLAGATEARSRARALSLLDARPGETVLEIGAGTGLALVAIARAVGPAGLACGIDLSFRMCRAARSRVRRAGDGQGWPACGDALRLPLGAMCTDAILMGFTLETFDEAQTVQVLGECRRVLKAEGRLAVAAVATPVRETPVSRAYAWAHRRFPGVVDCRPIDVEGTLGTNGFQVREAVKGMLWGLPVTTALAARRHDLAA